MFDELIEKLKQEKIVYSVNQYDKGWNDAIDYIVSQYLEAAQQPLAVDVLRVSQSSEAVPGVVDEIEELWS